MRYLNRVMLIGNVCNDPYFSDEGKNPMAVLRLATNRYWKNAEGEQESLAEYHDVCTWGAAAENVRDNVTKGKLLYIEGYLKTRAIEKEENTTYRTEVITETFIMLDRRELPDGGIDE